MDRNRTDDLLALHMMAISNTPTDPDEAAKRKDEYLAHRRYCIERYGTQTTFRAESYGVDSFYCPHCGIELLDDECDGLAFVRSVANGRVYECPGCGEDVVCSEGEP